MNAKPNKGLNKKQRRELIDLLRKNLSYQTPRPIFGNPGDEQPSHVDMRFIFEHQQRILYLINKAGGWVLPQEHKAEIISRHEDAARTAYNGGADYDLSHLSYGDMVQIHRELEGVDEMSDFRKAIGSAMQDHARHADG